MPSRLSAEWSEHKNVVRNKSEAVLSLRQMLRAETLFSEQEAEEQRRNVNAADNEVSRSLLDPRRDTPLFGLRKRIVRSVNFDSNFAIDKRIFDDDDGAEKSTNSRQKEGDQQQSPLNRQFPLSTNLESIFNPEDLTWIHERLLLSFRRSLLGAKVRAAYLSANADDVVDFCRLSHAFNGVGGAADNLPRSGVADSKLLQVIGCLVEVCVL